MRIGSNELLLVLMFVILGGCGRTAKESLDIRFSAEVGGEAARCGARYEGVGTLGKAVELSDARFYVSAFELHRPDGTKVPLELAQDTPWQHGGVALLDFEDGSGRCAESGTAQTNASVLAKVPPGEVAGLSFEIGVPRELNHLDALSAPSPLNLNALYWNWRLGYIFTKVEFWNPGVDPLAGSSENDGGASPGPASPGALPTAPTVTYLAHLGSTGCQSPAPTMPPTAPCSRPNRTRIFLEGFDPKTDEVKLDLAGLVDGIDITRSVLRPPGCMSAPGDPDCRRVFANLGLDIETGRCFTDCSDQKLAEGRRRAETGG